MQRLISLTKFISHQSESPDNVQHHHETINNRNIIGTSLRIGSHQLEDKTQLMDALAQQSVRLHRQER